MSAFAHGRNSSEDTTSSGSSYHAVLDHIMNSPGSYDIPLRTMYTLNCSPRAQPLPRSTTPSSNSSSPVSSHFPTMESQQLAIRFTNTLLQQINQLPTQPASLPPSFVTSFVRRCFAPQLELVDFPQALTALDYLKDLEARRRREFTDLVDKLNMDSNSLQPTYITQKWCERDSRIAQWVPTALTKDKKIDALYTQCYIGLRRWILVNEMSLGPFNKHNCLAMLNTLYPPMLESQPMPTKKLTEEMLKTQREGFFKYIRTVEKRGTSVLENLVYQGRKEGEATGWPNVNRVLNQYLTLANSIISECHDISSIIDSFSKPQEVHQDSQKRKGRKIDSGVSFDSDSKHNKTPSTSSSSTKSTSTQLSSHKSPSVIERLTRDLRRIRSRQRLEVAEILQPYATDDTEKENSSFRPRSRGGLAGGLRKMWSLGTLGDLKHNTTSAASLRTEGGVGAGHVPPVPAFDREEMRKERQAFERRARQASLY